MAIQYRPDIDGLRALAIIPVVLFHAGVPFVSGGFVGVDIFFVISGFLITSIILKEQQAGQFSLWQFWERRARRILPPLAVVMLASLIAGWFLFLPSDFVLLGKQMLYQSFFASNVLFSQEVGYFDTNNDIKPLLHTWSLSVEEQFYIVLPLALLGLWRYLPGTYRRYLIGFAVISFVLAVFKAINGHRSGFYLLPYRAWELMLGAFLAFYVPKVLTRVQAESMAWIGLAAILMAVFLYTSETPFPGLAALLPCGGAAMVIWANTDNVTRVGRLLSLKPIVFIGLISYAWYLWHWPLMAYVHYIPFREFSLTDGLLCATASFLLAILSWRFIERPVRHKMLFPTRNAALRGAVVCLVSMAVTGGSLIAFKGVPARLDPLVASYAAGADDINPHRDACDKPDPAAVLQGKACQFLPTASIKPTFFVWGDSHADAAAPVFYALAEKHQKNGMIATSHGCGPFLHMARESGGEDSYCYRFNHAVFDYIASSGIKQVVLVASWSSWVPNTSVYFTDEQWYQAYKNQYSSKVEAALQNTVDRLQDIGVKVYVLLEVPTFTVNPPYLLAMEKMYGVSQTSAFLPIKEYRDRRSQYLDSFIKQNARGKTVLLDPEALFCTKGRCMMGDEAKSFYFNEGHLSPHGAQQMAPLFEPYFKKF